MDPDDDLELLRAWQHGDSRAGSALYKRHAFFLSRFLQNKLSGIDDAADLIQETFLALLQSKEARPKSVRHYMYGIAKNVLLAHLRKKYKREHESIDFEKVCIKDLDPSSMSSILTQQREAQAFVEGLRAISLEDQILLEYKYFDNLSLRDIAHILGLSETTLPGRLQRAKDKLKQKVAALLHARPSDSTADEDLDRWAEEVRLQMSHSAPTKSRDRKES